MLTFSLLVGHAPATRGEDRRGAQLADLALLDLDDEGPQIGRGRALYGLDHEAGEDEQAWEG